MRARSDPLTENSLLSPVLHTVIKDILVRPGRVRLQGGRRVKSVNRVQQFLVCVSMLMCSPLSPAASVQLWRLRLGRVLYSMANCLLLMKVRGQLSCSAPCSRRQCHQEAAGKSVLLQA